MKSSTSILNSREILVLKLICKQYPTPRIAEELGYSEKTIAGFRESLMKKTKSKNVVGMVLYAIKKGIYKV